MLPHASSAEISSDASAVSGGSRILHRPLGKMSLTGRLGPHSSASPGLQFFVTLVGCWNQVFGGGNVEVA